MGALDSLAGVIVEFSVLVFAFVFADVSFTTDSAGDTDWAGIAWAVAIVVAIACVVIAAVPKLRVWVMRAVRQAVQALSVVAHSPSRVFALVGSNLLTRVLYALVLGCTVKAFHESLSLGTLLFVIVSASLLGAIAPVPGNVGVAEAAIAGGLIWAGIPEASAFAAAVTYRILTAYIPPVIGAFALRWLQRHDYLA